MDLQEALKDWTSLNDVTRVCSEKEAHELLKLELKGKKRKNFVMRCYSRMNRLRALRERKEINAKL